MFIPRNQLFFEMENIFYFIRMKIDTFPINFPRKYTYTLYVLVFNIFYEI